MSKYIKLLLFITMHNFVALPNYLASSMYSELWTENDINK